MRLAELLSQPFGPGARPTSIYIHIPFCSAKCAYCDFFSLPPGSTSREIRSAYVDMVLLRLGDCVRALDAPFETLYIGGGTPTVLEDEIFERLLKGAAEIVGAGLLEWTVEANPESLSPRKLEATLSAGVTRLSLGIQSMDPGKLDILGRRAGREDNERAIDLVKGSGVALSVDLISAIPEFFAQKKTLKADGLLADSLDFLLDKGVGHLSLYDLVVEEGTLISRRLQQGELFLPDEDKAYDERKAAESRLAERGFERYEVSNFAPTGSESIHNAAYWSMRSYLGIGSGAVSTLVADEGTFDSSDPGTASLRIEEGKDLRAWLADPDLILQAARLSRKDSAFETIMMGLRTKKGLDVRRFSVRFGVDVEAVLARTIKTWKDRFKFRADGYLSVDDGGMDLLNPILVDALADVEARFSC